MLGYVRVSTEEQERDGFSIEAQTEALTSEAERRGWEIEIIADAGYSGRTDNRPGLQEALRRLKSRKADGLAVVRLDRLARSVKHLVKFTEASQRQGWHFAALDMSLDTTTPNGRLVVHILAAVAQWESEMIGQRTKEGMAAKKAQAKERGESLPYGFSRQADDTTVKRIRTEREEGASFAAIASGLDADGIPTPGGGKRWYASTVQRLCKVAS